MAQPSVTFWPTIITLSLVICGSLIVFQIVQAAKAHDLLKRYVTEKYQGAIDRTRETSYAIERYVDGTATSFVHPANEYYYTAGISAFYTAGSPQTNSARNVGFNSRTMYFAPNPIALKCTVLSSAVASTNCETLIRNRTKAETKYGGDANVVSTSVDAVDNPDANNDIRILNSWYKFFKTTLALKFENRVNPRGGSVLRFSDSASEPIIAMMLCRPLFVCGAKTKIYKIDHEYTVANLNSVNMASVQQDNSANTLMDFNTIDFPNAPTHLSLGAPQDGMTDSMVTNWLTVFFEPEATIRPITLFYVRKEPALSGGMQINSSEQDKTNVASFYFDRRILFNGTVKSLSAEGLSITNTMDANAGTWQLKIDINQLIIGGAAQNTNPAQYSQTVLINPATQKIVITISMNLLIIVEYANTSAVRMRRYNMGAGVAFVVSTIFRSYVTRTFTTPWNFAPPPGAAVDNFHIPDYNMLRASLT